MLSGAFKKIGDKNYNKYEFGDADRFLSGIDLINQNKANKIDIYSRASFHGQKIGNQKVLFLKTKLFL